MIVFIGKKGVGLCCVIVTVVVGRVWNLGGVIVLYYSDCFCKKRVFLIWGGVGVL